MSKPTKPSTATKNAMVVAVREASHRIAMQLLEARHRLGLTQREFAALLGTSHPQVVRLERGTRSHSVQTIVRAATALGCQVDITIRPREP